MIAWAFELSCFHSLFPFFFSRKVAYSFLMHGQSKCCDFGAAQTLVAVVEDDILTRCRRSNRFIECHVISNTLSNFVNELLLLWRQCVLFEMWKVWETTKSGLEPIEFENVCVLNGFKLARLLSVDVLVLEITSHRPAPSESIALRTDPNRFFYVYLVVIQKRMSTSWNLKTQNINQNKR